MTKYLIVFISINFLVKMAIVLSTSMNLPIFQVVLYEQVKAWVADKNAEALRCQKLLVEEEEAAKKRY